MILSCPYQTVILLLGEQLTIEQLLQLLLVHSANDAANALAEYVGGSVESFVSMMNTKIHELGLSHTHFTNTFGMHNENHYTTAQDLATIMKYCIKNETFRKLCGSGREDCIWLPHRAEGSARFLRDGEASGACLSPDRDGRFGIFACRAG